MFRLSENPIDTGALARGLAQVHAGACVTFEGWVRDHNEGRAVLRLSGRSARDVLAKGCRLDLHPRAFRPGMCAQTAIAQIGVLLHQVDERPTYDLYVAATYALDFFEWLSASAGEFGYRIEAAR